MEIIFYYLGLTISVLLGIALIASLGAFVVAFIKSLRELYIGRKVVRALRKAIAKQTAEKVRLSLDNLYSAGCKGSKTLNEIEEQLVSYKGENRIK